MTLRHTPEVQALAPLPHPVSNLGLGVFVGWEPTSVVGRVLLSDYWNGAFAMPSVLVEVLRQGNNAFSCNCPVNYMSPLTFGPPRSSS